MNADFMEALPLASVDALLWWVAVYTTFYGRISFSFCLPIMKRSQTKTRWIRIKIIYIIEYWALFLAGWYIRLCVSAGALFVLSRCIFGATTVRFPCSAWAILQTALPHWCTKVSSMWVSAFVYLYDGLNSRTKLVLRLTFQTLQATDFLLYKNFKYFDYSSRQTIEVEFILFKKDFENEGEKSWAPLLLYRAFVFKSGPVSFLLVDCVNRHSCDADCRKSAILRRWLVRVRCIPITCSCSCDSLFSVEWLTRLVRQVGPPHVNSDNQKWIA